MFENRLRILLIVFIVAIALLVIRLVELQVVRADSFRKATEQALVLRPTSLPFVRGSILDRQGNLLVGDKPSWDLRIDYEILAADSDAAMDAMKRQIKRWKKSKRYPGLVADQEIGQAFRAELDQMWRDIVRLSPPDDPVSIAELHRGAADLVERIQRVRKRVEERRGFDSPVAEETQAHTVLEGLDRMQSIAARELFEKYPWVHVEPSSNREFYGDLTSLAHVIGRTGKVDAEDIERDPNPEDPFARYQADERVGTGGVEFAAEALLRGRRGEMVVDRDGQIVELFDARNGHDVVLTIDTELQDRIYHLLGETVHATPDCSGGSIVILDVNSREILALVSYPSFDPVQFNEQYEALRDDTDFNPLLFRAMANHYAPGSIVKPLVCLTGLHDNVITLDTREECTGYLLEDHKDRWRCWEMHGTHQRMAHGSIDVVAALTGSCNIFMYRLGERLGVGRLTEGFARVRLGEYSGLGFREEVSGINPTPEWLSKNNRLPITAGHARNFAIGQGEVTITPLQAANLMACYASGKFQPVSLFRNAVHPPASELGATPEQWAAIRRGIYGVVNDTNGTAYKYAHFEHPDYVLCGKTGSATTASRPTSFRIRFREPNEQDWQDAIIPGRVKRDAEDRIKWEHPNAIIDPDSIEVVERWPRNPPENDEYAHAWFAGYLQSIGANGEPQWSVPPRMAFAVLVEYGGSGGRVSGPLAKKVAAELIDLYGTKLDVDARAGLTGGP